MRRLIIGALIRKAAPTLCLAAGLAVAAVIDAPNWRAHRDAIRRGEAYTTGGR